MAIIMHLCEKCKNYTSEDYCTFHNVLIFLIDEDEEDECYFNFNIKGVKYDENGEEAIIECRGFIPKHQRLLTEMIT
ncbi:MAG: hypothetical protein EAX96_20830 [Candidatus Lokiarchaeota archaeon]|nr:hypothetical protein [Candidatus Lokiarchaeota archaeon]